MHRRFLPILAALLLATGLQAQSVTPQVWAVAGDLFTNSQANLSISFTIGEMAMVETFSAQSYHLTQGFQQPTFEMVGLEDEDFVELFEVYPNPAFADLNLRYSLRHPGRLDLRLHDMRGVEVVPAHSEDYGSGVRAHSFDVRNLAHGMYILQVEYRALGGRIHHLSHFKINVINP